MTKARILIVEDETIVARDIRQQLTELGYVPVGDCPRGEEAVVLAERLRPDLVLMDIQLAGPMDGVTAAEKIHRTLALPVVFLTAFAGSETLDRAKRAEPYGYIVKPFEEHELGIVIEMALYKHAAERRLRESESRFRLLVETSMDAVLLVAPGGRIVAANAEAGRMFGGTEAELRASDWRLLTDDSDPRMAAAVAERERTGRFRGEVTLVRRDGAKFTAEISTVSFTDPHGEQRSSIVVRDVTKLRRTEELMRLQGAALEAAANAIVITDASGAIEWVNPAFSRLTGYAPEEAIGRNPRELVKSNRQDPAVYAELWRTVLAGRPWHGELINRRKDGSEFSEEQTITPLRDPSGTITHFVAIKQDLTAAKRAEQALQQSEERYRTLFDWNPLPMLVCDAASLQLLACNTAAQRLYGYTRDEMLAQSMEALLQPEEAPRLRAALALAEGAESAPAEWRHRRKDGTIVHVEVSSRPLELDGRPVRLVLAADVTEKKNLQEQFLRAQRIESLGMLAAGIAHDLNNMLAPVLFVGPLLRQSRMSEGDLKIIAMLERSAERGVSLVRQILAFARGTSGEPRLTQVKHVAREVAGLIEGTFPKSIRVEQNLSTNPWPAIVNPTQIHQVLLNLCVNARDAMPEGGVVRITASNCRLDSDSARSIPGARAGAWLRLEVADTGCGIPAALLEKIWDPFFSTKSAGKGTGLGLATVRGIVSAHFGFVEVRSTLGKGTVFRVYLPAEESDSPDDVRAAELVPPDGKDDIVLVADDDEAIRDIIAALLGRHGYQVLCCADGVEAITRFNTRAKDIALVITDVDMPNLGGEVLARVLRQLRPDVRILAMSGHTGEDTATVSIKAAREASHGFLVKPFTADALLAAVHRIVHAAEP